MRLGHIVLPIRLLKVSLFFVVGSINTAKINAGGHGREEIPVPIPNTEVKVPSADDTGRCRESRKPPVFFIQPPGAVPVVRRAFFFAFFNLRGNGVWRDDLFGGFSPVEPFVICGWS